MFYKLSLKNIFKSFKDYSIYFLTLLFGVAIFYIFNSLDSQTIMSNVSESKAQILQLMTEVLGYISIFISFVLGFLIVYANNFLIKRRKKEFGIYMTLGMGKSKISRLLLIETVFIGILSLAVGLAIGLLGSQFMSVFVAKLFEVDMNSYTFVISKAALLKTVIYFGVIYLFVMVFNTFSVSKCKLIDLLNASRKNEKIKLKNPVISIILFIISVVILVVAYRLILSDEALSNEMNYMTISIILGIIGTFMFFASLSGFVLKLVQSNKKLYLKGLNTFVLRQINSKINTTVVSMGFISLMLFLTICILSSAWSLNISGNRALINNTPVDISATVFIDEQTPKGTNSVNVLNSKGFNVEQRIKEYVEIPIYCDKSLTQEEAFGSVYEEIKEKYPFFIIEGEQSIISLSDYNKVAKLYGREQISLQDNEYAVLCDFEQIKTYRDKALKIGSKLDINGNILNPKYDYCIEGFLEISPSPMNTGFVILPDSVSKTFNIISYKFNGNYQDNLSKEAIQENEDILIDIYENRDNPINIVTKQDVYISSLGVTSLVTFIGLYLGIIFLITSAAILALKELSESSDNKQRYSILRKIGVDEKMINKSLFAQIGIFFLVPLVLSIIHSVIGLMFANNILSLFGKNDVISSIIITAVILTVIYGGYFIATYLGSKAIIKE